MNNERIERPKPTQAQKERADKAIEDFYKSFREDLTKKRPFFTDKCCIHCRINEPIG